MSAKKLTEYLIQNGAVTLDERTGDALDCLGEALTDRQMLNLANAHRITARQPNFILVAA